MKRRMFIASVCAVSVAPKGTKSFNEFPVGFIDKLRECKKILKECDYNYSPFNENCEYYGRSQMTEFLPQLRMEKSAIRYWKKTWFKNTVDF